MIGNYFKVAFRNQRKHKTFSFINIFGLAAAMTICLLIGLMLSDQKKQDAFNLNKDRVFRVLVESQEFRNPYATSPFPLADELNRSVPSVEAATRVVRGVGGDAVYNKHSIEMRGYFTDPSFFKVFSYEMEAGNPATALKEPNSIVLTSAIAKQLFRDESPVGKTIQFTDRGLNFLDQGESSVAKSWGLFTVTGVIADKKYKSHLPFEVLMSVSSIPVLIADTLVFDMRDQWSDYYSTYTYALVRPDKTIADLNNGLAGIVSKKLPDLKGEKSVKFKGQSLTSISPGILLGNEPTISLPRIVYYFLGVLALVIMISAGFNYTNLSVARALSRSKEIGIRKVNGASRKDLIIQFLSESVTVSLIALCLAMIFIYLIRIAFVHLWVNQYLHFELTGDSIVYGVFVLMAVVVGLFAGFYPALYLSRIEPVKALRSAAGGSPGKLPLRKLLSVFQFVISLVFIISAILIFKQSQHFLHFKYEFNPSGVVNVELQSNNLTVAKNELSKVNGVEDVSACEYIPVTGRSEGISLKSSTDTGEMKNLTALRVDQHFLSVMQLKMIAGNNLSTDNHRVVINQSAVTALGFRNAAAALGQTVITGKDSSATIFRISGVVQDFHMGMDREHIDPLILINDPSLFKFLNVRISSENMQQTLSRLNSAWTAVDPVHSFKYKFFDEQVAASSKGFFDMVSILGFMAFLAVTIACLGMLGMAVHTTERRRKEVGIRKTLGAPMANIFYLLSREFILILIIAVAIAAPLSFFINNLWLRNFPNRVTIGWDTIVSGILIITVLGGLTIGSQTFRAARTKPTEAMKSDM
jgi:putative ABC transport system permease protein